ncbi:MAG: hypothetical protein Q8K98_00855 [Bacteroidota bacterium]|nr:hypothetical protein [Bacteroidota bacterium]
MEGWIKLHRSIEENEMYFADRFTRMQAWIDLLLLANHKAAVVFIRGIELRLKPGESFHSWSTLGKRWKWNRKTVGRFLKYLRNKQMIHYRTAYKIGVITIVKWENYQSNGAVVDYKRDYKRDSNKNVKKNKPEKKSNRMSGLRWL